MRSFFKSDSKFSNPLFIGTVEDNTDPTFNYRLKVRIAKLHPSNITTSQLPWAARVDTAFMGIGEDTDLDHKLPEVGSQVLILAVGEDINSLLYIGGLYKKTNQTPTGAEYKDTYGIYMKNGQFIGINKVKKLFQMLFDGDINIDKIINMTINVSNAVKIECQSALVKASTVTVDSPITTFTGDVIVEKNITAKQEVSANNGAVTLTKHTHLYKPGPGGPTPSDPGQG